MNSRRIVSSQNTKSIITIKLLPRSSKNQIVGKEGDTVKVRVTPPPVDGKANEALIGLLAKRLRVSKSNIKIVSGRRSKLKSVQVVGLSQEEIAMLLENPQS
jgi:uncharacterized protein (TIGR00251 family)